MLRLIGFFLYEGRFVYWIVASKHTQKKKPAEKPHLFTRKIGTYITFLLEIFIGLQLLGILHILQVPGTIFLLQGIGLMLLLLGTTICIISRIQLGTNWTHGSEYQVKNDHALVTSGIYAYIRHPIYFGYFLSYIGAELVAGSYLYISFFAFLIVMVIQAKREEKLFVDHFGNKYQEYQKRTKMLIPYIL